MDNSKKNRRTFAKELSGFSVAILAGLSKDLHAQDKVQGDNVSPYKCSGNREDKAFTSPPGSESLEHYLNTCTACQICVNACKAHVLKPSFNEWGLSKMMVPYMDFSSGFCLDDCVACATACPVGAIKDITVLAKKSTKIGTAQFNPNLCVVKTDETDCAACGEHCLVQAIEMIPHGDPKKSLYIPHVHEDVCIGCGACESVCPVTPHKAIVIQGVKKHIKSKDFTEDMRVFKIKHEESPASSTNDDPFSFF